MLAFMRAINVSFNAYANKTQLKSELELQRFKVVEPMRVKLEASKDIKEVNDELKADADIKAIYDTLKFTVE